MTPFKIFSAFLFVFTNTGEAADLLERYRGSPQEILLDQQTRNYRAKAALNAKSFGRGFTHRPGYDRHIGLEKLRKPLPRKTNREVIPISRIASTPKSSDPKSVKFIKE